MRIKSRKSRTSPAAQGRFHRTGAGRASAAALSATVLALSLFFAASSSGTESAAGEAAPAETAESFLQSVRPFLEENCVECHSRDLQTAGMVLEIPADASAPRLAEALRDRSRWADVWRKLRAGEMPPPGRQRPGAQAVDEVLSWIEGHLSSFSGPEEINPGRVTARRLNRAEYNNTIRDLLGVGLRPADEFPVDDSGYGFDTIGDVLSIAPVLMEKYLSAADEIARAAIVVPPDAEATVARYESPAFEAKEVSIGSGKLLFTEDGSVHVTHEFPYDAKYRIEVRVRDDRDDLKQAFGAERVLTAFSLDDKQLGLFETNAERTYWSGSFEVERRIEAGRHVISSELLMSDRVLSARNEHGGRAVFVDYVEITGPFEPEAPELPESHRRIFTCGGPVEGYPPGCAREILERLARRAYRRPVSPQEVDDLVRLVELAQERGEPFERGIQVALKAILVSPQFLFRIERDPAPGDGEPVHRISPYELASRLSYFLWSSMPDEELFEAAERGDLFEPDVLEQQVRRMLRDPKAKALAKNFAGQWLELRNLELVAPDPKRYPSFDDSLREAMRRETELFFEHILREDRSVVELLDAGYTFLNERLARHYGIEGVEGGEFRRVELESGRRGGVITHASVLTVSSYPTRTSPVLRGKWLLDNILGAPPPPPPPGIPELDEEQIGITGTLREQLEQHRANPNCAVCHERMDALGFGLENYDPIGAWRTQQGKFPVDSSGKLPGGRSFDGPAGLKRLLVEDKQDFARRLTEKMLIYALGRGLESYDKPVVEKIMRRLAAAGYRFSQLILEIVQSPPFQMRRAEPGS